jgi:hypothetical protein
MDNRTGKCSQCGAECKLPAAQQNPQLLCEQCNASMHLKPDEGEPQDEHEMPTKITPRKDAPPENPTPDLHDLAQ